MALRDSMRDSVQPFLAPGETVSAVFGAQTGSQYLTLLYGVLFFLGFNRYRIVAATDRRLLVLDAGKVSVKRARAVVADLPLGTPLGEPRGVWHAVRLGGETLRVHRRFFKDLQIASAVSV